MLLFKNLSKYGDVAHLILRLAVAAVFINHGLQKWALWTDMPPGMPATMFSIMRILAVAEPAAGLALVLGLLTRVANVGLMIVMVSALVMKLSGGASMNMWEIDLLLLTANIVLFIAGPGKYSLDAGWMKK